jgi:hypothetical protein
VLLGETWLADRLEQHGVTTIFDGLTDQDTRRERFRRAILDAGLEEVQCGRAPDKKPNTYRQAFERLYGEKL